MDELRRWRRREGQGKLSSPAGMWLGKAPSHLVARARTHTHSQHGLFETTRRAQRLLLMPAGGPVVVLMLMLTGSDCLDTGLPLRLLLSRTRAVRGRLEAKEEAARLDGVDLAPAGAVAAPTSAVSASPLASGKWPGVSSCIASPKSHTHALNSIRPRAHAARPSPFTPAPACFGGHRGIQRVLPRRLIYSAAAVLVLILFIASPPSSCLCLFAGGPHSSSLLALRRFSVFPSRSSNGPSSARPFLRNPRCWYLHAQG